MSRSYDLQHTFTSVTKLNFKNDLLELIDFDEDINGNNGLDYTKEEAKEKGFESTIEWAVAEAIEVHGETRKAIADVIESTVGNDGYYEKVQYAVEEYGDHFIVSIACMSCS